MLSVKNVEVHRIRCYRFDPISFFPLYAYEDILEIEFSLAWYLHGYRAKSDTSFREFYWLFDRLKKQLEDEKNRNNGTSNMMG